MGNGLPTDTRIAAAILVLLTRIAAAILVLLAIVTDGFGYCRKNLH
jgi:hypothetical protein